MIQDLTEGKPHIVLWKFSIPMFVSVIFQQMYNMADSMIAGKFAGEKALAAVGASYPITMIFMAIAVGSNIGCSVIISQLFGAKKYKEMKTAISTTMLASLVLSGVLTVAGLFFSRLMMVMVDTPADIFGDSALYLRIYIGGFLFLFVYNVCTGIFNSLGDSRTPLYFLIGSSLGNIFLDYVFVAVFHWDVAGVAWATFLAQGVACILVVIAMYRRLRSIPTEEKPDLFSGAMLAKISYVAIPSILQQSFISVGNIFIQRLVNGYGSSVIAGYSAAIKLNTFAITSFTTLANGLSSFTAQNMGAGKHQRVRKGFQAGTAMALLVAVPFAAAFVFAGSSMVELFMEEKTGLALDTGVQFLKIVSPFYFIICIKLMADGVLRGAGAMKAFMTATFVDLILRVILAFVLADFFDASGIWMAWPVGWIIATAVSLFFYFRGAWEKPSSDHCQKA